MIGAEATALGAKEKVRPVYQNKTTVKLMTQLNKLPYMVLTYDLLYDMEEEQRKAGCEPSKDLVGAVKCQYKLLYDLMGGNPDNAIRDGRLQSGQSYIFSQTQSI